MGKSTFYQNLGIEPFINAAGHYTAIGGSRMSERTLAAMKEAAADHVDIRMLQKVLNEKIALMTNNEAAYISNGAAAGLYLGLAASVVLKVGIEFDFIKPETLYRKEVIVFAAQSNPYERVLTQLGLNRVLVGHPNTIRPASANDVRHAITEETVAILYVAGNKGGWMAEGAPSFEQVAEVAKERNIPLIVDAAAQLPPVENLWAFTGKGADLVVFSGGKDLAGPQSSGLVLGNRKLLDIVQSTGFPHYGIGRMMKVGREEMAGLYTALEQYLEMDHARRNRWFEEQVDVLIQAMQDSRLFKAERSFPNEAGQPVPRAFVRRLQIAGDRPILLHRLLLEGSPRIFAAMVDEHSVYINPLTLHEDEMHVIIARLQDIENT